MSEEERPTLYEAVREVLAFLDARGPDRHNVIATAGPRAARYNKPRLRMDHLQRILDEIGPVEPDVGYDYGEAVNAPLSEGTVAALNARLTAGDVPVRRVRVEPLDGGSTP